MGTSRAASSAPASITKVGGSLRFHESAEYLSEIINTQNDLACVELDPQVIMRMVAGRTQKLTSADGASVQMLEGDALLCRAGSGVMHNQDGMRLPVANSLVGQAVTSGQTLYASDTEADPRVNRYFSRRIGARSLLAVPLIHGSQRIGAIVVASARKAAFDSHHIAALQLMAGLVSASLVHAAEFEIKKRLLAERTAALSSLRESEARFRSSFDHAAIGMALVSLSGRWLQVNQSLCRIVGYSERELLDTDFQSISLPEDLNADLERVRQLIAGEIVEYQMVKRYIHRQGHLVWVLLSVSLVRTEQGAPAYFISQIQDITARQMAEEALRASEAEFRVTFEGAGVGKVHVDLQSRRFIRVNRKFCQLTGYSAEELQCKTFLDITHPDDVDASVDRVGSLAEGRAETFTLEKRYVRKDGRSFWGLINAAMIPASADRPARLVCTIQDITERRRAEWLERDRRHVLEMIATGLPLTDALQSMARSLEQQIEGATAAALLVLENGAMRLHGGSLSAELAQSIRGEILPLVSSLSQSVWDEPRQRCGISQIRSDNAWESLREKVLHHGVESCWTVPVTSKEGTPLALLCVLLPHDKSPDPGQLQTLELYSRLATICIEHHHATDQLSYMVRHDRLTGLPNRLMFEDRLQHAIALAGRSGNHVALLALDLDKFKSINDTFGHLAGDQLLQNFSQRINSQLRDTDTMARTGGDEFVIVLPELPNADAAAIVAQKLINSLAAPLAVGERELNASTSIGIALYPGSAGDAAALMKQADTALYRAKESGRNGFSFAPES